MLSIAAAETVVQHALIEMRLRRRGLTDKSSFPKWDARRRYVKDPIAISRPALYGSVQVMALSSVLAVTSLR